MRRKSFLAVTGCIFSVVAVVHAVRVIEGWSVQVGPWAAPMWVSWVGIAVAATLAVWAFKLLAE